MLKYFHLSIDDLINMYTKNPESIKNYIEFCYNQYKKYENLNSVYTPLFDDIKTCIHNSIKMYKEKKNRPLEGIPIMIKDNFLTKDILTTCGSKMLNNFIPCENAFVIKLLKNAGAIIVGKTAMEEFAMGSLGTNTPHNIPHNIWKDINNQTTLPGGSSSGSAITVSCGMSPISLGSDTGGSCRVPAAFCGIVGFKPTYGVLSRNGLVPLSSALDVVGSLARRVKDIAKLFNILSVKDHNDASSITLPSLKKYDFQENKKKIFLIKEFMDKLNKNETYECIMKTVNFLKSKNFIIEEISVPIVNYCVSLYYNIVPMEAMSNLAKFDGIKYGAKAKDANSIEEVYTQVRSNNFGKEVKRRIYTGAYLASNYFNKDRYKHICAVKREIFKVFESLFKEYDFCLLPTSAHTADYLDDYLKGKISIVDTYNTDVFTTLANIIGCPAISIPTFLSKKKLPLSVTLMTKALHDEWLFNIGNLIEEHFDFNKNFNNFI